MKDVAVVLLVSCLLATNLRNAESKRMSVEEIKEILQPVQKICIERVGVDPKLISNAMNGNFVPDRKLQCYFKCMLVMAKVMTKDDQIIAQAFVNIIEHMLEEQYVEPAMATLIHCQSITSKPLEGCELAYELAKCAYEHNSKLSILS